MPIEFTCPSCNNLVGTPDAAAGKKGRCPSCGAIVMIPLESEPAAAAPPPADGVIDFACPSCRSFVRIPASFAGKKGKCPTCQAVMMIPLASTIAPPPTPVAAAAQTPLRPLAPKPDDRDPWLDLPPPSAAAPTPSAVFDAAAAGLGMDEPKPAEEVPAWKQTMERAAAYEEARGGLSWERGTTIENLIDTSLQLCTSGGQAFDDMQLKGNYGDPITFYITSSVFLILVYTVLYVFMTFLAVWRAGMLATVDWLAFFHAICLLAALMIASVAISGSIGALIGASCVHVALLIFGGARQGFETTFRVLFYTAGTCNVIMATCLLCPTTTIFGLLLPVVGLSRVHKVPIWKSSLAYLLGSILSGVAIVLLYWLIITTIVASLIIDWKLQEFFRQGF